MPLHDGDQTPDRRIRFRIGINIGDVIPDGTNLHGDGVNVAARLEAMSPIGGICVSRSVRDHVHGRLDLHFEPIGLLTLKNIERPVEAFVLRLDPDAEAGAVTRTGIRSAAEEQKPSSTLPDKPSLAVLPFQNMSGDPEQEYFADGVVEDIITALSRIRWLLVIARNSSFAYKGTAIDLRQIGRELGVRYLVEGSVRRGGEHVRVTAQLIDAEIGSHVWAQRYDRKLDDVFAVQDEITLAIARAIEPAVDDAELRRVLRKPPGDLGAWETYQRGMWNLARFRPEDAPRVRELFVRALELDPTLAVAHTGLAVLFMIEGTVFATRGHLDALRLSGDEARKALELDPTDANALAVRALAVGNTGDHTACAGYAERALSINQNCVLAYRAMGWTRIFTGRPAEGRDTIIKGIRLDPRLGSNPSVRSIIAMSYYFEHDYEETVAETTRLITDNPDHPWAYRWLAAALGQLGRSDEARAALDKAIGAAPDSFRLFVEQRMPWMGQAIFDHMLEGLRKAGWQGRGETQV